MLQVTGPRAGAPPPRAAATGPGPGVVAPPRRSSGPVRRHHPSSPTSAPCVRVCAAPEPLCPGASSLAAAAAAGLAGTWLADYSRSTGRDALLTGLGLTGLQRETAKRLIEGMRVAVKPGGVLEVAYLTVVPFFQVTETFNLDGTATTQRRRDLRPGSQSAVLAASASGSALAVEITWPEPAGGCLVETYALAKGGKELVTTAQLMPAGGGPVASATTVYTRTSEWRPRYRFPGRGDRRSLLLGLGLSVGGAVLVAPPSAQAGLGALLAGRGMPSAPAPPSPLASLPPPPLFPRRTVDRALGVLLMRSCYDALDAMDVCPMDDFQAAFWKLRQGAWEPYIEARRGAGVPAPRPPQGDLSDPAYLDFISWAQWSAFDDALDRARADFAEACAVDDDPGCATPPGGRAAVRRVVREGGLPEGGLKALAEELRARAGDAVLGNLRAGFQGVSFNPPPPPAAGACLGEVAASVQGLLDVLMAHGYALSARVTARVGGVGGTDGAAAEPASPAQRASPPASCPAAGTLAVRVEGSALQWGCAARQARGLDPNALDALATAALLRAGGVAARLARVRVTDAGVEQEWEVGAV